MKRFACLLLLVLSLSSMRSLAGPVRLRFLAESMPEGMGEIFCQVGKKEGEPFRVAVNQVSETVTVPAREIGLHDLRDKSLLATIKLPETGDAFVVLLALEADGALTAVTIPSEAPSFRAGDVYFFNHTDRTITGKAGLIEFELSPGEGKAVRPTSVLVAENHDLSLGVREEGGVHVLRTMRWPVQTRFRSYGFFFRNVARNRIEFRAVDEFVEAGKKPTIK